MVDNFTQKEMLIRVMNKLDTIENKLNDTHELALTTNGKVKLHTKIIYGVSGALITIVNSILILILK